MSISNLSTNAIEPSIEHQSVEPSLELPSAESSNDYSSGEKVCTSYLKYHKYSVGQNWHR